VISTDCISKDSPSAAAELVRRIQLRINRLAVAGLSHMGRPGLAEGTRELIGNAETAGLEAPQNLPFISKVLRTALSPAP
jgi:hypothetical protein